MVQPKKQTDFITPAAIVLGVGGLGFGIYYIMKKPPGIDPGDQVTAIVKFDYDGPSDEIPYVISIRFGNHDPVYYPFGGFDPQGSLEYHDFDITLSGPGSYEYEIPIDIPPDAKAGTWDAECFIRYPEQTLGHDWIVRVFQDNAITVRKA